MAEDPKIVAVSDLLQRSRPFSATARIPAAIPCRLPPKKLKTFSPNLPPPSSPSPSPLNQNRSSESYSNTRFLSPLPHPAVLVGTVDVPDSNDESPVCENNDCFTFSDGSAKVCCSVLRFNARILRRHISVVDWNYIPMKPGCGVLEIIRWEFVDPVDENDDVGSSPLVSVSPLSSPTFRHSCICGKLASISSVLDVPCTIESRSLQKSWFGHRHTKNGMLKGFLAEILVFDCLLCDSDSRRSQRVTGGHSFTSSVVVYFCGPTSSWRPILLNLIGCMVSIGGVRKKLVSLGIDEAYEMFVASEETSIYLCESSYDLRSVGRNMILGDDKIGSYMGTVTGCFMQGMVIELDNKVWLMLTNRLQVTSHSLRVGAVVYLSNAHFILPNYPWDKVFLLGVCSKTTTSIKAFSSLETKSHFVQRKQSLLGDFVDSLTFAASFWVLLLVSCFRKKFAGIFTEQQLLGSKHKKGLAQIYAGLHLPSCAFHLRHSAITEFCRHDCCNCGHKPNLGPLKLVVPISCFISYCEAKWITISLQLEIFSKLDELGKHDDRHSSEANFCSKYSRRIISSEEIGVALLGVLQFSLSSKRLQLHDATGTVEVVVPDLLSDTDLNKIYEVKAYKIICEGLPIQRNLLAARNENMFSCRNIFNFNKSQREMNQVQIYVHFLLKNASCLNVPFGLSCSNLNDKLKISRGVNFHILLVTHKYPAIRSVHDDSKITERLSLFAEAIIFPYALFFLSQDGIDKLAEVTKDDWKVQFRYFNSYSHLDKKPTKRSRVSSTTNKAKYLTFCQQKHINFGAEVKVPCMLMVRDNSSGELLSANLIRTKSDKMARQKVLLEFCSESCIQYEVLRIGAFYMMKFNVEEDEFACGKALVSPEMRLWSLSFFTKEDYQRKRQKNQSPEHLTCTIDKAVLHFEQTEAPNKNFTSDFHLYLPSELEGFLEEVKAGPYPGMEASVCVSLCNHIMEATPFHLSSIARLQWRLPEGALISVHGNVMNVHRFCAASSGCNLKSCSEICIHVHEEHHMVKIRGVYNPVAWPVGMAPGANATFYRVLVMGSCGRCELMLTPVSFIVVNFITEVSLDHCTERSSLLFPSSKGIPNVELASAVPLCIISQLFEHIGNWPVRLRCRVASVHVLLLEYKKRGPSDLSKILDVSIPLAGFVLDDGSSSCCCWADEERAACLLSLRETSVKVCNSAKWNSKLEDSKKIQKAVGYLLEKLLKKHKSISVKKCGSIFDSMSLDLAFSIGSGKNLSIKDENLLKFLILNACCGQVLTVVGHKMDSDAVEHLRQNIEIEDPVQSMQNIWTKEVGYVNPLKEARNLVQEFSTMLHSM